MTDSTDITPDGAPTFNRLASRFPTPEEIADLKGFLRQAGEGSEDDLDMLLGGAYLIVLPNYSTGGYGGRVLIALYDSGLHQIETFGWSDGEIFCARLSGEAEELAKARNNRSEAIASNAGQESQVAS